MGAVGEGIRRDSGAKFPTGDRRMKLFIFLFAALPILVGCTSNAPGIPSGERSPLGVRIESANESSVTLTHIFFSNDSNNLRIADEYCKTHGKSAQFVSRENDRRRYNCVR